MVGATSGTGRFILILAGLGLIEAMLLFGSVRFGLVTCCLVVYLITSCCCSCSFVWSCYGDSDLFV